MRYRANGGLLGPALTTNTAFASGMWSMPEFQQKLGAGTWPTDQTATYLAEPNFEYVTMLLKSVGANTAQNYSILDSSASNLTVTRYADVTQGAFSPFSQSDGGWSVYLDGTGDYVSVADNAALEVGSNSFTLECWFFIDASASNASNGSAILAKSASNSIGPYSIAFNPVGALCSKCSTNGSSWDILAESAVSFTSLKGAWHHVALVRNGSAFTLYLDGTSIATATNSGSLVNNTDAFRVGDINYASTGFPGYISNVRLVTGTAVYTSAFTPSITPLTAISGTSLLTCQSNRFKDNSTNAFTITRNGDSKISAFGPLNPSSAYSASGAGGSLYFDGVGDYLSSSYSTTDMDWYSSDYTLEAWVYIPGSTYGWAYNNSGEIPGLIGNYELLSDTVYWSFGPITDGTVRLYYWNGAQNRVTSTATVLVNQWNHIAFTKTSSGITIFVNGVASSTTAVSGTPQSSASVPLMVGRTSSTDMIKGYVSGLRIVKGTALYSGNFTPPTTPATAITNTKYLLNGTNAGIIDASRKVNLYTAGNAQVSTNVYKYDKSIYLDGTGDYVYVPASEALKYGQFGTGDFTVEAWVNFSALAANRCILDAWVSGQSASWQLYYSASTSKIRWYVGASTIVESTTTPTTGTWYHVAVCRSGTTIRLFINGTLEATTTSHSTNYNYSAPIAVGVQYSTLTNYLQGYVEDLRITNGYARYTSNFTVPANAFNTL